MSSVTHHSRTSRGWCLVIWRVPACRQVHTKAAQLNARGRGEAQLHSSARNLKHMQPRKHIGLGKVLPWYAAAGNGQKQAGCSSLRSHVLRRQTGTHSGVGTHLDCEVVALGRAGLFYATRTPAAGHAGCMPPPAQAPVLMHAAASVDPVHSCGGSGHMQQAILWMSVPA